ncbi:MAG: hypothetical protein KM296_00020 [Brockia lithotrophica]|nr:hypothetical protein [Brockia lithotrophica]
MTDFQKRELEEEKYEEYKRDYTIDPEVIFLIAGGKSPILFHREEDSLLSVYHFPDRTIVIDPDPVLRNAREYLPFADNIKGYVVLWDEEKIFFLPKNVDEARNFYVSHDLDERVKTYIFERTWFLIGHAQTRKNFWQSEEAWENIKKKLDEEEE